MKTFEIVLEGFDGDTDATDSLIKWVSTYSEATLKTRLNRSGVKYSSLHEIEAPLYEDDLDDEWFETLSQA